MFTPKLIDTLARQVIQALPNSGEWQQDVEKNLRAAMQNTFSKMDLVTREEFDIQREVLMRTRSKVDALEKQIAELEARILRPEE